MNIELQPTPGELGYQFPAEWAEHRATWLSYPHDDSYSWPGTLERIFPFYNRFIKELTRGEQVCINVRNNELRERVIKDLTSFDGFRISLSGSGNIAFEWQLYGYRK